MWKVMRTISFLIFHLWESSKTSPVPSHLGLIYQWHINGGRQLLLKRCWEMRVLRSDCVTGDISLPFHREPMDTHVRSLPGRLGKTGPPSQSVILQNSPRSCSHSPPPFPVPLSSSTSDRGTVSYKRTPLSWRFRLFRQKECGRLFGTTLIGVWEHGRGLCFFSLIPFFLFIFCPRLPCTSSLWCEITKSMIYAETGIR